MRVRAASRSHRRFAMTIEFRAMGTTWWVGVDGADTSMPGHVRTLVEEQEQRCSRFRADSELSRLNSSRRTRDRELIGVIDEAMSIRDAVRGAFDPAVGAAVIAAGYDSTFDSLQGVARPAPTGGPVVERTGTELRLSGSGALDLGGIAKGFTVDRVGEYLAESGCRRWVVDGGGDILVGGSGASRVESYIGVGLTGLTIRLSEGAVATSSTLRRAWGTPLGRMHHIIAPLTGRPARGAYVHATVVAPSATVADALATAVLVDAETTVAALPRFSAQALLVDAQGGTTMTPGMGEYL